MLIARARGFAMFNADISGNARSVVTFRFPAARGRPLRCARTRRRTGEQREDREQDNYHQGPADRDALAGVEPAVEQAEGEPRMRSSTRNATHLGWQ